MDTSTGNSSSVIVVSKEKMRMENPFTLKVGQVFTGFGIGCGIGIGVGRPLNLGAIPVLNQVMVAAGGASDAFSGVARHVNHSLRKLGANKVEAGIGCGVGFGHGFGVESSYSDVYSAGLAVKPGVMHQIQSFLVQATTKMMVKFGVTPSLSTLQGVLPASLQNGMTMVNKPTNQTPEEGIMQSTTKFPNNTSQGLPHTGSLNTPSKYGSQTQKVISNFLKNPMLNDDDNKFNEQAGQLRSENNMLQMVLKHQQVIEELMEENEKLRQILVDDLKIPASKLLASYSSRKTSPCAECFECRRRQRKR
ncbi:hypothetical protein RJ639_014032 [Escallonia herrerae]|uniref:Uncharacterized protein n=1 Tax=Escallonia herrerae TaxID=1293975 RepID=A0AA88VK97_9ASTE|nr:hypothetical protein RJ639_014032 [Escallonia herrerae]